jgi:hypothetical protein
VHQPLHHVVAHFREERAHHVLDLAEPVGARQHRWFWLATVRPNGAPHVDVQFAAWAGTSFFIASKDRARKSRNLEGEPRCVISADTNDLRVIVERIAHHVPDQATLQKGVRAFETIYGWPTRVDGRDLVADDYGAPHRAAHRTS